MALVKNSQESSNSSIGQNSFFTGKFYINGSLRIDGKFEGQSLHADQLYVGSTGKVKTNIIAMAVVAEGTIIGNITAKNRVLLLPTAKILGDIKTPELIIQNGVILEGKCNISHGTKVSAKSFIEVEYEKDSLKASNLFPDSKKNLKN